MYTGEDLYGELGGKSEHDAEAGCGATDPFFRDVVGCELDLAHAACAESLCEGIVAEDSVCGARLF